MVFEPIVRRRGAQIGIEPRHFVTVDPKQSLDEALRLMARHQVRRLPVVEEDGKLVGIVAQDHLAEIVKEVGEKDAPPARNEFIDGLKVSSELRAWLKGHDVLDLTTPDMDQLLTPDDIIHTPEFLLAYQRTNSGGVTNGLPKPKYTDADKTEHPEKYEKLKQDYLASLKKFLRSRPETMSGVELELDAVNPQRKWAALQNDRRKRVQRVAPDVAQLKFLAAKADTDLEGRASLSGVAPGDYWISSLNLDADAGDMRVRWDVPVKIDRGKTIRVELSNLNSIDTRRSAP